MTDSRIRAVVFLLGFAALLFSGLWWVRSNSITFFPPAPPPRPLPCPTGTRCFSREEAREIIVPLGPEWSEWYLIRMPPGGDWGLAAPNGTELQVFGGKEVILFERLEPSPMEPHLRFRNPRGGSATFRAK